jgi:Mn2+/Fe2+ NRAMP family transporter
MSSVDPRPTLEYAAVEAEDSYALSADAIVEPPVRLWDAVRQIGPGLILAGSIVGTGELIATTHLGAKVGFALLWLVMVSCFIKVFVQAELGRHAISSGQTTFATFRQLPGGTLMGAWWVIMMLSTQLQMAAMVGGVGQALHMAMPGVSPVVAKMVSWMSGDLAAQITAQPVLPWAVLVAVGTSVLLAVGGYSLVERGSTGMVVTFTVMTVVCVALLPSAGYPIPWGQVGDGLKFSIPDVPGAAAVALAMFGITGVGATELVAYPYWCIEKGYARKTGLRDDSPAWARRARGWLRVMKLDAWLSMVVYTVATLAFYFLGAAVLHGRSAGGLPGDIAGMLQTLSGMYSPVLGERVALWFIVIGVFAVLYSTLYSATGGNSRSLVDFLKTHCGLRFTARRSRAWWVAACCMAFPILDLILFIAIKNPVKMVLIGGTMQAITLPMLAGAAVYLRYKRSDSRLTPGVVWDVFLWLSLVGMFVTAGYGVWDYLRRLSG